MKEEKYNVNNATSVGRSPLEVYMLHRELQKRLHETSHYIGKRFKGGSVAGRMHVRVPSELHDGQIFSIDRRNIPLSEVISEDSLVIVYGDYGLYGRLAGESRVSRGEFEWTRMEAMWRFLHDHCGCVMAQDMARECADETGLGYGHSERYLESAMRLLIKGFGAYLEKGGMQEGAPQVIDALKQYAREEMYFDNERNLDLFDDGSIRRVADGTVLLVAADRAVREEKKFRLEKRLYKVSVHSDEPEEMALEEPAGESIFTRAGKRIKRGLFFNAPEIDEREYARVLRALKENLHELRRDHAIRVLAVPPRPEEVLYYARELMENEFVDRIYVSPIDEVRPTEWLNL